MHAAIVPVVPAVRLKKILVATDFSPASEAALAMANLLARRYKSELRIVHVWSLPPLTATTPEMGASTANLIADAAQADLERLVAVEKDRGIKAKSILEFGDPLAQIQVLAEFEMADLLVLGTHGSGGVMRGFLGSVAESLIRSVSCPVLTVGPRLDPRFLTARALDEVLVPTDLSPHSMAIIPYLTSITSEFYSRVHFLHVLSSDQEQDLKAINKVQEKIGKICDCHFAPRTLTGCDVVFGEVAEQVLAAAGRCSADLIAMGVKPTGRFLTHLRNTGYRIIANARCPVLTVKA